jgi:hypothetical protein
MTLDDSGEVIINGDLTVTGNIAANSFTLFDTSQPTDIASSSGFGVLIAASKNNDLEISLASNSALVVKSGYNNPVATITASGSAIFKDLTLSASSSGTFTIDSGEKTAIVSAPLLTESSQVIVTFEGDYYPATKYWITKTITDTVKRFIVHTDYPVLYDTKASYIIINKQ